MFELRDARLYRLDTSDDIAAFFRWLSENRRYSLSFDTETGGETGEALKWYKPGFKCRLVQFGDCDSGYVLRADRFGSVIEEVFTQYEGDFVSHNGIGFDGHVLQAAGFSMPPKHKWHDTLMQSRLIDPRGFHSLKDIGEKHFGVAASIGEKLLMHAFALHGFGKDKGLGFSNIPYGTPVYDCYSAVDVVLGARLDEIQRPKVLADFEEAYLEELGAWWVTFEHESKGLPVDIPYSKALKQDYEDKLVLLRGELQGYGIAKPNSKTQRLQALYLEGFEPEEFTESGEVKLDKKVLETIATPTAQALIEYGRVEGWLTKYIDKVIDDSVGGKVYPSFNPFGAKTGRQAAYGPPVQQLPGRHEEAPKIRRMFLPREGEDLWSIDYDGEENRLLAHYSEDEALTRLIMSGEDIHKYTASVVYQKPEDEVTKEERSLVKNMVYAEQYGAGLKKLGKMLSLGKEDVIRIKRGIQEAYPGVTAWKKQVEEEAKYRYQTEGVAYAHTWGGRRVFADEYEGFEPKYFTLANYILQGTGADILKRALNRIAAAGLSQYIYLPVHDELLFSLPKGPEGLELAHELARIMTFATEFRIPITCSPDGPFNAWEPH